MNYPYKIVIDSHIHLDLIYKKIIINCLNG